MTPRPALRARALTVRTRRPARRARGGARLAFRASTARRLDGQRRYVTHGRPTPRSPRPRVTRALVVAAGPDVALDQRDAPLARGRLPRADRSRRGDGVAMRAMSKTACPRHRPQGVSRVPAARLRPSWRRAIFPLHLPHPADPGGPSHLGRGGGHARGLAPAAVHARDTRVSRHRSLRRTRWPASASRAVSSQILATPIPREEFLLGQGVGGVWCRPVAIAYAVYAVVHCLRLAGRASGCCGGASSAAPTSSPRCS